MLDWDTTGKARMAALQSDAGRELLEQCGRDPSDISSIVLVESHGKCATKSDAILKIGYLLNVPLPLLSAGLTPLPKFVRDGVYDTIASNRYRIFGDRKDCRLSDERFEDRFVT